MHFYVFSHLDISIQNQTKRLPLKMTFISVHSLLRHVAKTYFLNYDYYKRRLESKMFYYVKIRF